MRTAYRSIMGACLLMLALGVVLAARSASAQTPAVAPVLAPANPVVPGLTTPAASVAVVAPPRVATATALRPQARVYRVPSQGAASTRQSERLSWPTRRFSPLARPWLSPN